MSSLFNVEWQDSIICLANFYDMIMVDVTNKMLLYIIINLEPIFLNKFMLSFMTLSNVIYLLCIAFFIVFCCLCYCAVLSLHFMNNTVKINVSIENYYFNYIIIINSIKKRKLIHSYTYKNRSIINIWLLKPP